MTITVATEKDIPDLDHLVHTCYRGEESFKGWTTEAHMLDGSRTNPEIIKKEMSSANITILKYTNDEGQLVGCVSADKQIEKMSTGMLCVRPDLQNKGLGRKLMSAVQDLAISQNCTTILIHVISARQPLVAWYLRQGFQKVGTKPFPPPTEDFGIPKTPLEFVVMEKPVK